MLTEITLENFRCFHEQQAARLAPLTLLVGENSTGKTSFMAMTKILFDIAYMNRDPNFKEPPYDLGSFSELAHGRGGRGGTAESFSAGFEASVSKRQRRILGQKLKFNTRFIQHGTAAMPICRSFATDSTWVEECISSSSSYVARMGTKRGEWEWSDEQIDDSEISPTLEYIGAPYSPLRILWVHLPGRRGSSWWEPKFFRPINDSPKIEEDDAVQLYRLLSQVLSIYWIDPRRRLIARSFASAPVRSRPRRTYDPARPSLDPEGDYVPMYLAELATKGGAEWSGLKASLERFGKTAGLFDELRVRHFDKAANAPFQIQVRKASGRRVGAWRNLIDVGYGISQVLPVITELLRPDASQLSLWQQPEIHLHPSAQAALATFFCDLAADGKQLIVETHGDYLLDRVRMDVRDGKTGLKPDDVSVLYFERTGLDVQIHSLRFDAQGNVLDAPPGYRQFFLEEVNRSLGL